MASKDSIVSGILKYSISTWINLIVGFVSVIITTRILSPEVYGQVSIFFSVTSVIMYILTLGLDGALIRFYNEPPKGETSNQLIYKCIVISVVVCLLVGGILTFVCGTSVSDYVFGVSRRILTGMVFIYTLSQILLRYLNISYRMSFRTRQYTIQNVLMNCASRALLIGVAFFTNDFFYISTILALGVFLITITYIYIQRTEIIPIGRDGTIDISIKFNGYGSFIKFALFSAPTYIVAYLNTYINQQIIVSNIGTYALGIFASTSMFGAILTGLKGGFGTYWSAFVYKNYKNQEDIISRMHSYVLFFSIIMASFMILFRDVIYIFIGSEFHESKEFFSLLLMSPILLFILETTDKGIAIANKNQILLVTHIISIILNVILCVVFIPICGLKGAAISNAISALSLYVMNTFWGQKYYKSINSIYKSIVGTIVLTLVLFSAAVVYDIYHIAVVVIILDSISIIIFRKEVNYLLNLLKNKISHI